MAKAMTAGFLKITNKERGYGLGGDFFFFFFFSHATVQV
jgi:hypothetical protein